MRELVTLRTFRSARLAPDSATHYHRGRMTLDAGTARNLTVRKEGEAPLRLVLVEDHTVLRDGLKALLQLQSDVLIVGEYSCAESGLNGIHQLQPNVVVRISRFPGLQGSN
jgi:hypothetical protein